MCKINAYKYTTKINYGKLYNHAEKVMLIKRLFFKKHRERGVRLSFLGAMHTFGVSNLFGVIVLSSPSLSGTGVSGDSKFASESFVVSGVSWLVFPIPNIQGT